jgi:hypothetical protein
MYCFCGGAFRVGGVSCSARDVYGTVLPRVPWAEESRGRSLMIVRLEYSVLAVVIGICSSVMILNVARMTAFIASFILIYVPFDGEHGYLLVLLMCR